MNKPIGYMGETPLGSLYKCHYSGHVAIEKHMKIVSPVLPQCPVGEAMFDCELSRQKRKESIQAFHEMDRNCNQCKHFNRTHADNKKGSHPASNFVYGHCHINDSIKVHVADWMGMECWESRCLNLR